MFSQLPCWACSATRTARRVSERPRADTLQAQQDHASNATGVRPDAFAGGLAGQAANGLEPRHSGPPQSNDTERPTLRPAGRRRQRQRFIR
jgi:hypothetical protein